MKLCYFFSQLCWGFTMSLCTRLKVFFGAYALKNAHGMKLRVSATKHKGNACYGLWACNIYMKPKKFG